jgi:hypothetical protein
VGHARIGRDGLLGGLAVGGVVVLAAQPVVIDPGLVSDAGVKGGVVVPGARRAARSAPAPSAAGNHAAKGSTQMAGPPLDLPGAARAAAHPASRVNVGPAR